jgi:DNA-binding CsgD family transcriptional regulator
MLESHLPIVREVPRTAPGAPDGRDLISRAQRLAGCPPQSDLSAIAFERWLADAEPRIDAALRRATAAGDAALAGELLDLTRAISDERLARRAKLFSSVQAALGLLRTSTDLPAIFDRGVRIICDVCGFDRAIIFRVDGSIIKPERVHFPADPEQAERFRRLALADPPRLTHMLIETEMIRRRAPVLVADARNDPRTHKPLIEASDVRSYVAAPILPENKVIGFIHADRRDSGRDVDALDRDILFTFAEGFGYAVERTILLQRLQAQRREVRRLVRTTEALVDDFADAELQLAQIDHDGALAQSAAAPLPLSRGVPVAHPRLDGLLTRRELEVLGLLAEGMTNAQIAERLVISPTTVKSHVQGVLRKLRASNRAEAVSRYLRFSVPPAAA